MKNFCAKVLNLSYNPQPHALDSWPWICMRDHLQGSETLLDVIVACRSRVENQMGQKFFKHNILLSVGLLAGGIAGREAEETAEFGLSFRMRIVAQSYPCSDLFIGRVHRYVTSRTRLFENKQILKQKKEIWNHLGTSKRVRTFPNTWSKWVWVRTTSKAWEILWKLLKTLENVWKTWKCWKRNWKTIRIHM